MDELILIKSKRRTPIAVCRKCFFILLLGVAVGVFLFALSHDDFTSLIVLTTVSNSCARCATLTLTCKTSITAVCLDIFFTIGCLLILRTVYLDPSPQLWVVQVGAFCLQYTTLTCHYIRLFQVTKTRHDHATAILKHVLPDKSGASLSSY